MHTPLTIIKEEIVNLGGAEKNTGEMGRQTVGRNNADTVFMYRVQKKN